MKRTVNICRPGYGASCSLCCGSHNYDMVPHELEVFFRARGTGAIKEGESAPLSDPSKLFEEGMQCPWVGFTDSGMLGCRVYNDQSCLSVKSRHFFDSVCRVFVCRAAEELLDSEILYAAELSGDWYYYPLLINDITILRETMKTFAVPGKVPPSRLHEIKQELAARLKGLC